MKKLFLFFALLSSVITLCAQELTITGTVKDSKGDPIPNININESGKNLNVQTNGDGNYKITASRNSTLVFRGVGYTTQNIKVTSNTINVSLVESTTDLDAVTVVGYSAKKKSELSSAVSVVSGEKLNDVTSVSLATLIQGKVPGVVASTASGDPTSSANIVIRGAGTINASTGPLYVVDGNIGGSYNPADVETITVLRDAAATGLYGSRAANGVIIVTTKKGKNGETKFSLSSAVGIAQATMGNFSLMNAQELFNYQSTFFTPAAGVLNNDTDWWDLGFRTAMINNHTLTASGGSEKTQFYLSGNYYKEEGTQIYNDKTQYSLRANIISQLTKRLKLTALLNGLYINDNYNSAGSVYQSYLNLPYDPAYNADGTPVDARYGTWYGRDRSNFLHSLQYNYSKARSYRTTADLNLDYTLLDNLTISTYNRANIFNYRSNSYYDKRTKDGAVNNGSAYVGNSFSSTLLSSNRIKYSVNFGKHNISALAVGEIEKGYSDSNSANAKGLPAGRDAFSTATDIISNPTGGYDNYQFIKYLGQVDYSLADKYFAVASVVNEYSSRFGSNNPDATFYQLGGSWIISNEKFMENVKPISFLKLRGSYGTTGNADGIGYYASMGLYNINSNASYAGLPGAAPSQMANPNLTWEKSKSANIGLEIGLFKRIDISIDAYQKKNSSLLFFRELPATTGYSGVYENVGVIRNRGLELSINSKNIVGKDFTWETNFNIAMNRNKVLEVNQGRSEVYAGATQPIGVGHNMDEWFMPVWAGVNPADGKPLWQNSISDADGNSYVLYTNTYNLASRVYTGKTAAPKFTGGLTNTFAYKNFTLSTFFNFVQGNYVYNTSRFYFDNDGLYESYNQMNLAKGWSRWEKPGDIATHPKPVFGRSDASNQTSTRYLEDGSYLRLRNATLGYNLPDALMKKIKFQSARIFVSGDNLWTLTKFSGTDPEVDLASGDSSIKYPTSRKFMFGLNVSF